MNIAKVELTPQEANCLAAWLHLPSTRSAMVSESTFLAHLYSTPPLALHSLYPTLYDLKYKSTTDAIIVQSLDAAYSFDEATPTSYKNHANSAVSEPSALQGAILRIVGEMIGFQTQQHGNIFNDIIARKEHAEVANSSAGFLYDFDFHTEDAFHEHPPDYIALLCIRNEEAAATVLSSISDCVILLEDVRVLLSQPLPMPVNINQESPSRPTLPPRPILSGTPAALLIRVNFNGLSLEGLGMQFSAAITRLRHQLEENAREVILSPGDLLLVNNRRVVHKRKAYSPAWHAAARWLSRVVLTNDLNATVHLRDSFESRVLKH
jgi:hypothetical protein